VGAGIRQNDDNIDEEGCCKENYGHQEKLSQKESRDEDQVQEVTRDRQEYPSLPENSTIGG
jgi:hypothetical protein